MPFSSMFIASTGLHALGTGMQTISNNIANASTVGFKSMRTNYQDLISETYLNGNFPSQVGKGAKVGSIQSVFNQGAFKHTQQDTDMAIAGEGFFNVRHKHTGNIMYSRAGNFDFSKDGYLQDPSFNILQGWKMSIPRPGETAQRMGNPVDIQVTTTTAPPVVTTEVKLVSNLNAGDSPAYRYPAYAQSSNLANAEAQSAAQFAKISAMQAIWFPLNEDGTGRDTLTGIPYGSLTPSDSELFNTTFIENYNEAFGASISSAASAVGTLKIVPGPDPDRASGEMTLGEFEELNEKTATEINDPDPYVPLAVVRPTLTPSDNELYNTAFLKNYNESLKLNGSSAATSVSGLTIVPGPPGPAPDRTKGEMTKAEFDDLSKETANEVTATDPPYVPIVVSSATVTPSETISFNDEFLKNYNALLGLSDASAATSVSDLTIISGPGPAVGTNGEMTWEQFDALNKQTETDINEPDPYVPIGVSSGTVSASNNEGFNKVFLADYNQKFKPTPSYSGSSIASAVNAMVIVPGPDPDRTKGELTWSEFEELTEGVESEFTKLAQVAGDNAYDSTYKTVYDDTYEQLIEGQEIGWASEGDGFAGAWNAQGKPPMDNDDYTYSEPLTVYDSKGEAHTLMAYYQKNPHMENVWDYIITSNPLEDARLCGDGSALFSSDASFAGLVQKGKMTFSANEGDPLQHGGLIKSMEAQNIDLARSLAAVVENPIPSDGASSAMQSTTISGYYSGSPEIDPATGAQIASKRTYSLTWGFKDEVTGEWKDNNNSTPPRSGMTWMDDQGNSGFIPMSEKAYPGPYEFGSGLSVTFDANDMLLNFGTPGEDSVEIVAHSEQVAWTAAVPNEDGVFDIDLSFVDKSSGIEPPYPVDSPALTQTVSLNQGAKFTGGDRWVPDEVGTTQYAMKSNTILKEQDGYPESSLNRLYVRDDGMVMGVFGHNREEELYQVSLTRFINPEGLRKMGDNLFALTDAAGLPLTSAPGEDGAGDLLGGYLEQSTVDTATEITNMIFTQRGFQSNSKIITTADTMLSTAIELKR